MKVHLPLMIQDPMTARFADEGEAKITEGIHVLAAPGFRDFLDGPVTPKVAVLDFDPATGALVPGAKFLPPKPGRKLGRYDVPADIYSPAFIQVSVLGAIFKTLRQFEDQDVLGREVGWAFDAPQLLVVPRAGEWANAFYERSSHSLQFFFFKNPNDHAQTVYTSLSRDIVAHETGHAIVDGIAPALYDALTPQSLALHEAMADLTALMTAFRSQNLVKRVLRETKGEIKNSTAFSSLAPEFGTALSGSGGAGALRSLWNEAVLDPREWEPHALSVVLSGALYRLMNRIYETVWALHGRDYSASGLQLALAAADFGRLVFRAIDFLPPGEVSFADYARALVAAERSAAGTIGPEIDWLSEEFQKRKIIASDAELEREGRDWGTLANVDSQLLFESDSEAHEFVNDNRKLLGMPPEAPYRLYPRLHTRKNTKPNPYTDHYKDELILKVSWEEVEDDRFDAHFPPTRKVRCGTTLVLDWSSHRIEAILTSDLAAHKAERDVMVRQLHAKGLLRHPAEMRAAENRGAVDVDLRSGHLKISSAARVLHLQGRC